MASACETDHLEHPHVGAPRLSLSASSSRMFVHLEMNCMKVWGSLPMKRLIKFDAIEGSNHLARLVGELGSTLGALLA